MKSNPPPSVIVGAKRLGATPPRRRRLLPWIVAVSMIALVVAGLWPSRLPVELAEVTRGDVVVTVNEEGMTRVKNRYLISSPVAGQLQRIDWKPGAMVKAGETVLAVLETSGADLLDARGQAQGEARVRGADANRQVAAAQLARAQATAKLAANDLVRFRGLAERGAISQQEFEVATMRATAAEQEVRASEFAAKVAEFEREQAEALLLRGQPGGNVEQKPLIITSPVSGRVLRVLQESSRVVPGGLPLLEVGDPTDLELRIEVLSRDGVAIQPGARVMVDQWGGPAPLEARVRLVEPSAFTKVSALGVEEQRVYVIADLATPVEQRLTLGDNYRIEARTVIWDSRNVLRVPAGAMFQRGGIWQTYLVTGNKAILRRVQIGRSNGVESEIIDGLKEGDRVIVYPGDKVRDGVRVREITVESR